MTRIVAYRRAAFAPALCGALALAAPAARAEPASGAPAATLAVEAIELSPERPAADTLCRLRVVLRNAGERDAAALGFTVRVGGTPLEVYDDYLVYQAVPAGSAATVELFNFWSSESRRPPPADGKLRVEVTLREAQWMRIADEDGVEVWTPLGAVEGLPARRELVVDLAPAAAAD